MVSREKWGCRHKWRGKKNREERRKADCGEKVNRKGINLIEMETYRKLERK